VAAGDRCCAEAAVEMTLTSAMRRIESWRMEEESK
jgi:hypothetical protein